MPLDHIRYDILTQDALREVIRRVLADAAAKGLPGDHHFFITFDTRAEGVRMSPRLKTSYPGDMTVVLQHQFWDLAVTDDHFEVGLAFNGIPERLVVPLKAVKGFFDPSVQFGLQFTLDGAVEAAAGKPGDTTAQGNDAPGTPPKALRGEATAKNAGTRRLGKPSVVAKPAAPLDASKPVVPKPDTPKPAASKPAARKPEMPANTPDRETAPSADTDGTSRVVRLDRFRKK
jgi:uncharacterized protein